MTAIIRRREGVPIRSIGRRARNSRAGLDRRKGRRGIFRANPSIDCPPVETAKRRIVRAPRLARPLARPGPIDQARGANHARPRRARLPREPTQVFCPRLDARTRSPRRSKVHSPCLDRRRPRGGHCITFHNNYAALGVGRSGLSMSFTTLRGVSRGSQSPLPSITNQKVGGSSPFGRAAAPLGAIHRWGFCISAKHSFGSAFSCPSARGGPSKSVPCSI